MKKIIFVITLLLQSINSKAMISNYIKPVDYFVNHKIYLENINSTLKSYKKVGIVGISGIGKTQLVRTFTNENKSNYELIWFLDCDNDIRIEFSNLAKVINNHNNKILVSEDINYSKESVLNYLSTKNNWLLVFDNIKIDSKIDNSKTIEEIVNLDTNGHIIFCSQDGKYFPNKITLRHLEKDDSIKIIKSILDNKDEKIIKELSEIFKGYPVLIAGGSIFLQNNKFINLEEYKKLILDSKNILKTHIELVLKYLPNSSVDLIQKISLINNQKFSKKFLEAITDNKQELANDLINLSRFGIINLIDENKDNPVFEMHDMIAEVTGNIINSKERQVGNIIKNITTNSPKSLGEEYTFTINLDLHEHLKKILINSEKANLNNYSLMTLKEKLLWSSIFIFDTNSENKIKKWFLEKDKNGEFNTIFMTNDQRASYASFFRGIGANMTGSSLDKILSINPFEKAIEILSNTTGYDEYIFNALHLSVVLSSFEGKIDKAKDDMNKLENLYKSGKIKKESLDQLYIAEAYIEFAKGEYEKSYEFINKSDNIAIEAGMIDDNLLFTSSHLLKSILLSFSNNHKEANKYAQKLYKMFTSKLIKEDANIFSSIFGAMALSEVGLGKYEEALIHSDKAISIAMNDKERNPYDDPWLSYDMDMSFAILAKAEALSKLKRYNEAIENYGLAARINNNIAGENDKNIAYVKYIYEQGAKASKEIGDTKRLEWFEENIRMRY
jgi:tetratricopeptide (TPR) repeat protein